MAGALQLSAQRAATQSTGGGANLPEQPLPQRMPLERAEQKVSRA